MQDIPCNRKILLFPPEPQETFVYYHTEVAIKCGNEVKSDFRIC